jgi:hypothetical protein
VIAVGSENSGIPHSGKFWPRPAIAGRARTLPVPPVGESDGRGEKDGGMGERLKPAVLKN